MTLRVYTDVTGMKPRTRLGVLLNDGDWAQGEPPRPNSAAEDTLGEQ